MEAISKKYTNAEICAKIKKYKILKTKIAELEKEMKDIGKELEEVAIEAGDRFVINQYTVSVSRIIRKSISYTEFAKSHPKLAKQFASESAYNKLNVK